MIAAACEDSEWESDPEAWKQSEDKSRGADSYFDEDAPHWKQVKPSQKAAHDYSVEKKKPMLTVIYRATAGASMLTQTPVGMAVFKAIVSQWRRETGHFSVFSQKAQHPLYQAIIDMGEAILPTLMSELKESPRLWFWALRKITKCNPVREGASVSEAVQDWSSWWMAKKK